MARIEDLAERYGRHIATPWQRTVAGAQRVVMVVYDKELERTLRARLLAFEMATHEAGHDWRQIDVSGVFAEWMAADDYRDEYFRSPEDLQLKLDAEFPEFVAERLRAELQKSDVTAKYCCRRSRCRRPVRIRPHFSSAQDRGGRYSRTPCRVFPGSV